jgi:hypothetical protein
MRRHEEGRVRWLLASDAVQHWHPQLQVLSDAILHNIGLLEAELLVGNLLARAQPNQPCVLATCQCSPQRRIVINRAALNSTENVCGECYEPFHRIE